MEILHEPVMVSEVLAGLQCRPDGVYVDGTLGQGGHSQAILEASSPGGRVIGLDQDPEAVMAASRRLAEYSGRFRGFRRCFTGLPEVLGECGLAGVDGVLLDLGWSADQLERSGRGFSFQRDEPLDMRLDPEAPPPTAADIVASWGERELAELFWRLGEERYGRRIARRVVEARQRTPIATSAQLAELVRRAVPGRPGGHRRHPATRVFQALRIAVNRELEKLADFLPKAPGLLVPGGRLVVIAYHSLEDRLVKHEILAQEQAGRLRRIIRKPLRPTEAEVARNPRARSAKLRVAARPGSGDGPAASRRGRRTSGD